MYNCFDMDCLLEAEIMIAFKARVLDWEVTLTFERRKQTLEGSGNTHSFKH